MLETIWFLLWGVLWAIYFILDGYDLGIGTLIPILGKSDTDRRTMLNAMGPFWDGNEVWLITAGGVTFAAFPRPTRSCSADSTPRSCSCSSR
jgi:cytochrome bd quinol oxidase subunit 2 apoprotein (EC 1.10.3.-)